MRRVLLQVLNKNQPDQFRSLLGFIQDELRIRERGSAKVDNKPFPGGSGMQDFFKGRLSQLARECIWQLIFEGILVIGKNNANSEWPWLSLSEYGEKIIKEGKETDPVYDTLLEKARAQNELIPFLDFYVGEALKTFRRGCFVASLVMLGCAAELIAAKLVENILAVSELLKLTQQDITALKDDRIAFKLERVFEIVSRKEVLKQLKIKHDNVRMLRALFDPIRMARNDAGHPTGKAFNKNEAYGYFHLFGCYFDNAFEVLHKLREYKAP